jgi:hypothetical protein
MKIEFNSLQDALVFILSAITFFTAAATLHWKVFVAPMLKKIISPFSERVDVVSRVSRFCHPAEYKDAEQAVYQEREMRRVI